MQKIPTLFLRNEQDRRHVTDVVDPRCAWVLVGEGTPTRKFDLWRRLDNVEGIVWHHPDGRMAKIKARDFPREAGR